MTETGFRLQARLQTEAAPAGERSRLVVLIWVLVAKDNESESETKTDAPRTLRAAKLVRLAEWALCIQLLLLAPRGLVAPPQRPTRTGGDTPRYVGQLSQQVFCASEQQVRGHVSQTSGQANVTVIIPSAHHCCTHATHCHSGF